ncbi:hypothetical protein [Metallosphaera hakonensis]|uniref:hypothetical protein n=1 Tax=Metallosphaera hakonensis TaxID=79601 RepID=UPI0014438A73|nr:hypothetical protein [Metallosphaera hakonensis]
MKRWREVIKTLKGVIWTYLIASMNWVNDVKGSFPVVLTNALSRSGLNSLAVFPR